MVNLSVFTSTAMARYILPIILMVNISTVFAEPICAPSFEKEVAFIPRQDIGELSDRSLKCWEFGFKNINYLNVSFRPLSGEWIEAREFGENSGLEFLTSSYMPSLFLARQSEAMRNEPSNASASNGKQPEVSVTEQDSEKVHPSIWVWVAIIVYSFFGSTTSELRGTL